MKAFGWLDWLRWWFIETKKCQHVPGEWRMRDTGMGKFQACTKCGKVLKTI